MRMWIIYSLGSINRMVHSVSSNTQLLTQESCVFSFGCYVINNYMLLLNILLYNNIYDTKLMFMHGDYKIRKSKPMVSVVALLCTASGLTNISSCSLI